MNNAIAQIKKPSWIKVKAPQVNNISATSDIVKKHGLNTVCEEAACPNIAECWEKQHATFMILGSICTRACAFCNVQTGKPNKVDEAEPEKIAQAVSELKLQHVVITSVDRDDLIDGGAEHFAKCIDAIRRLNHHITIEILTPDFRNKDIALGFIANAAPDVFNHNLETVPALYRKIRPGARYFDSLLLLSTMKRERPDIVTKSGLMVGLGESDDDIFQTMDDMRAAGVDSITIGQYLQPTKKHAQVARYVEPERFKHYEQVALNKGFLVAACGPMVRSSYHAEDDFLRAKYAMKRRAI